MGEPAQSELDELWSDREWRLNHLYYIEDKHGGVVLFRLNGPQKKLLKELHFLNIILKARQMGFSTFILILALDCALFNKHFDAGLIADTLDNAKGLLTRIKFAYERMDPGIKAACPIVTDNAQEIRFANESSIEVGVSLRSSTKNFLHVSEYGKICAKHPDKAKEIKSGALNTLARGQLGFIESTAEGRGGDFYDKTAQAQQIEDAGRVPLDMEWKFFFFPWFQDPSYTTDEEVVLTVEDQKYFDELLSEHGIGLTEGQKGWYAVKSREQGEDMWKEYPSTPEEAFMAARDGAYFAKEIKNLRKRKLITAIPFDNRIPVNTFWDWGISDYATIWLHQEVAGRHRFVGYHENSGEGPAYYANWLDKWAAMHGATFGRHFGPHDWDTRRPGSNGEITTLTKIFAGLGYKFIVVARALDKRDSHQNVRLKLPTCEFDEAACSEGIVHLESYSREWDDKLAVWKSQPRHDEHSHGADGFMTFADGWKPAPKKRSKSKGNKSISWMAA